jgi:hypothetical protein
MADYRVDWYYTRRDGVQITRWDWARNIDIARELVKSGRPYRSTHYAIKKGHAVIEHGKLGPWQKAGHLPFASAGGKWLRHGQPRSRCHDVRAPSLEERKSHFRRCGRLLARRGPPALPGSMVLAVDSCGLSRSCIAPIENAEAAPCKSFGNRRRSAHKAWSSSKSMPVRTRLLDSCWTPTDNLVISI